MDMNKDIKAYELIETVDPPILAEYDENFPSIVDRFFTRYYKIFTDTPGEDHTVLIHTNRICLITLAPSHIAFKKGIKSITYNIGNVDRSQFKVSGKGKKGGMILQPNSKIAVITCHDESEYKISSCIYGNLIETNERIVADPELIQQEGDGFIAIVLPKIEQMAKIKDSLLTQTQYDMLKMPPSTSESEQIRNGAASCHPTSVIVPVPPVPGDDCLPIPME